MFGHDKHDDEEDVVQPSTTPVNEALMGVSDDDDDSNDTPTSSAPVVDDTSSDDTNDDSAHEEEVEESKPEPEVETNDLSPEGDTPSSNDLLDIKRHALQDLSPLIGHLDQTPEEKFKTTMMMIQASDNQALVADAYEAAQGISDSKARAQALLDIINEINYFTQPKKD